MYAIYQVIDNSKIYLQFIDDPNPDYFIIRSQNRADFLTDKSEDVLFNENPLKKI